ncbi:MAG: zinc ABC transporter substrate-binding protein [Bacteroidales bacterium]|jgi:zinc transport system substrate-binding protein|nr:zinc ABC transporter substrate-binding protein [Bacteroidales bacterium]
MKFRIALVVLYVGFLVGCSKQPQEDPPSVTVSILPQKYFVEKIAGDHYSVNVMIPPGASPVTYEPTPQQMQQITNSQVYFRIGHIEFEKSWMKKFKNIHPEMNIVDLSANAQLIKPGEAGAEHHDHHEHHGHHHHGVDPHIWVSPREVKKQADLIYQYFIQHDPQRDSTYTANYQHFLREIEEVEHYAAQQLKPFQGKKFLIFHPALSYLARDYGLEQISIEIDGKEPTPANMQEIIKTARSENIKIVFVQKQFSKHNAQVIADEIDGMVVQINPLDYQWEQSMRFMIDKIVESYTKQPE